MRVSVIGATGTVGSATAFYIAAMGLADEIVMVDLRDNVLAHHAMDISTAVAAFDVSVKAGLYEDLAGSAVIINAAGVHQDMIADRAEVLSRNLPLVRDITLRIRRHCPGAFVITTTNPVDPLNYAAWRVGGFDRHQLIGYSLNDTIRFREAVATAKEAKVSQVEATVIGEHGSTQVPLFSSVRISGRPVSFTEEEKQRIRTQAPSIVKRYDELAAGRTAGWTCAIGLAAITRAVLQGTGEIFACSVVLDGEYGQCGLSMAVPAVLGRNGVQEVLEWELLPDEQAGVERTVDAVKAACRIVDEKLV